MAIYKEKDKKKWTKDGRSYYFRTWYTDMYGKKKQKQSKLYKGKKEAEDAESEFRIKIKKQDENDINILFEAVFLEWLQYKKQSVKFTTYYAIEKKTKKHILSVFKDFKLHSIKTNNLLSWKEDLKNKKTLCPESVNKIIGYFQEFLEYARINYSFNIKVCNKLQKDKVPKKTDKVIDAKWNFWTYDEFNKFIVTVDNKLDYLMFNFLYYTGLRIGEFTGLKWKNVDLKRKELKVIDNLTKAENGGFETSDPKTNNSIRIVELDDDLITLLEQHYNQEKKLYGFNDSMFVFGNIKYIAFTTFRNHLNKHIAKFQNNFNKDFKRITPHGFRHSHVSLLIHLGCDSREVAERIGDTVEMVEKTYYHMFPEKKSNAVKTLNKLKKLKKLKK